MSKKYGHIWRTNHKIHDILHQNDLMSSKEKHNCGLLAVCCPCGYDDDETRHIPLKNSANHAFLVKSVLEFNCKLFRGTAYNNTPNNNRTHIWKKPIPTNLAVKFANTSKKKRSVSNFFRLYLNNYWGHCPKLVCISPRVQFFCSRCRPEKQFWHQQGHQRP